MSTDDCFLFCFLNKNVIVVIISIRVHMIEKILNHVFYYFFFRKYNLLILLYI